MKITNKTILITGGGSGIGLEIAKLLNEQGNKILIIGRNGDKLKTASEGLKNVSTFASDITKAEDVKKLAAKIASDFSDLSIVINNAASAFPYYHGEKADAFDKASNEILTNYLSVIRLNEELLPLLKTQKEAAIVNTSSIVAFAPDAFLPSYSDSKAALHSYTLSLRHQLAKDTNIKVFELMPPLVSTEFSKEIGGLENGMPAIDVAKDLIHGIENDVYEILVGQTKDFRELFFSDPLKAFEVLNQK